MTILNSYVEKVEASGAVKFLIIMIIMFVAVFLVTSIQAFKDRDKKAGIILAALCTVSLIILFTIVNYESDRPKVTTYEVTLSDEYPATELLEKYDLVEQRGEILVIQEKEDSKWEREELGCTLGQL